MGSMSNSESRNSTTDEPADAMAEVIRKTLDQTGRALEQTDRAVAAAKEAIAEGFAWKERALKAEAYVAALEAQLDKRTLERDDAERRVSVLLGSTPSEQTRNEAPCRHEWYQGACAHCTMDAAEFRALKNAAGQAQVAGTADFSVVGQQPAPAAPARIGAVELHADGSLKQPWDAAPDERAALPEEPTHAMLKALAGDPLLLAASDEQELRRRYKAMVEAAWGGKRPSERSLP